MSSNGADAGVMAQEPAAPDAHDEKAFGFWLYLMSDAIIFALLFGTYVVMAGNTAGGPDGKSLFDLSRAYTETMILLLSSLTFGLGMVALRAGSVPRLLAWLLATFVLGLAFVVMELNEFRDMVHVDAGPDRSGFLSAYFTLVGTHGLHVSFGLIWLLVMMIQIIVKTLTPPVLSRLLRLGMFWHFLDIVWVGIFSVVYLPGVL
jgi:cytochrome o ubiquinol oxidase subunit 3